jgi:hypothetical protein
MGSKLGLARHGEMLHLSLILGMNKIREYRMAMTSDVGKLVWCKAQSSMGNGACLEVAHMDDMVAVRDSKDPHGAILAYSSTEWRAFLHRAKKGEFDHPC